MTSNRKGAIAEMKIATAATELGVPVLRPMTERERYDLAFELGGRLLRVQCKWASLDEAAGVIKVGLQGSWLSPHGYVRSSYGRTRSTCWPSIAVTSTAATFCRARW
jgi:hypothetical protein